eukprot:5992439-Pleurochrysis_carterae.AAC.1
MASGTLKMSWYASGRSCCSRTDVSGDWRDGGEAAAGDASGMTPRANANARSAENAGGVHEDVEIRGVKQMPAEWRQDGVNITDELSGRGSAPLARRNARS